MAQACAIGIVIEKTSLVDRRVASRHGHLEMNMIEHRAADRAFVTEVGAGLHLIADSQSGPAGDGSVREVRIGRPLAVWMGDPDIIVTAFARGAPRLLLAVAILNGHDSPRRR